MENRVIESPRHQGNLRTKTKPAPQLSSQLLAEVLGTFILVFFGCGSVATATIAEAQNGIWQVAVVWGFAVTLAIYATRTVSGAHLNPAVTLAIAVFRHRSFPASKVIPYMLAQLLGAFLAAVLLLAIFAQAIVDFEQSRGLVRGKNGSQLSAMVFGEYFPNPAIFGTGADASTLVSSGTALTAEAIGTAFLVFFILAIIDPENRGKPSSALEPILIGFALAIIISVIGPITQAGLNPARDLGPRLLSFFAGWGSIALPGPKWGFWIYIAGPAVGGLTGGLIYSWLASSARPPKGIRYRS